MELDNTYATDCILNIEDILTIKESNRWLRLSIKNAALIIKEIKAENKRISFFKIYPPTLKFSVITTPVLLFA